MRRLIPALPLGLAAGLALVTGTSVAVAAPATTHATREAAGRPALRLHVPGSATWRTYDGRVYFETQPQLIAGDSRFVLRSHRDGYDKPIVTRWRHDGRWVTLPAGTMTDFTGLPHFFRMVLRDSAGKVVRRLAQPACLNGFGTRVRPDAPPRSPYPWDCPYNPYTIGSVMGVQAGWVTQMWTGGRSAKLAPGDYTLTTRIGDKYRHLFHLPARTSTSHTAVTVVAGHDGGIKEPSAVGRRAAGPALTPGPRPAAGSGGTDGADGGPRPDLRSLPAWGIAVSPGGNHLNFSATVWNGGTSPMVVDGFHRPHQPLMDAYQYFFDKHGHQTGYRKIGHMVWDPRPSHHHWHFEDFAQYRLLNADRTLARRSHKEAFCLANTDAVDYTLPAAAWHPENTDLATACGDRSSPAVREELSVGSGDTYSQERAGQSFNLEGLPNGVYYVEVRANPDHRIVETRTGNNVSLRRVHIGGTPGHRTVRVSKVGRVVETPFRYGEGAGY